jgi:ABC-2 type transport system permease protein
LLLCALLGVGLTVAALALAAHRDFGAGMVAPRPGPVHAAPELRSPLRLCVRLHRGVAVWWALGMFLVAVPYGSVAGGVDDWLREHPGYEDVFLASGQGSITDNYLATALVMFALLAVGPALQILQRLRGEEISAHRAEAILANGTSRDAWATGHLTLALWSGAACLMTAGAGTGVGYLLSGGGVEQVPRLAGSALIYAPAVALLAAIGFVLFGFAPRWFVLSWAALVGCLAIGVLRVLFTLPQWMLDLSPVERTPSLPADRFDAMSVGVLTALAAALMLAGLLGFRARDVPAR